MAQLATYALGPRNGSDTDRSRAIANSRGPFTHTYTLTHTRNSFIHTHIHTHTHTNPTSTFAHTHIHRKRRVGGKTYLDRVYTPSFLSSYGMSTLQQAKADAQYPTTDYRSY